jgi:hypothetical protein
MLIQMVDRTEKIISRNVALSDIDRDDLDFVS